MSIQVSDYPAAESWAGRDEDPNPSSVHSLNLVSFVADREILDTETE